ncbi:similar to Saccharomyces cerevisiae YNL182C IPI3 Essential component of the Rix1 complex (Rix1p, Ipi1p, Ipi3p) that is required for processing of ITS2 sequences from 35S pre-rRNA [Maudiozyma barnettii]|uniref:Pre-rRNA-processing protein IPI3 n=1 Tax=Maudiozyma barnettii TaxID=61262 RepID=A0A8H2VEY3_9SACH|nr:chromatin-binding/pre-rRNA-processing protein IPI3 [Kazachstania barnettii]CAB4253889.1 similar to Saccharomyces cerevisiae YNL182C IPI3 Essential component of the Rix1 complex (Rix1p, Ipi1p, Ipi3p) that is required for processing of ITS2 sequences from 35S pre-rRNA [Kazachstania barnettii]CAD1781639.1 similar to Saccharomyces cerevisiae YNL182C IPI3 Essential component of the Rix1 complex (Rix1p, Ipi1p, Ipi3p) that is required for processing of ITS2 sequences from 35S pre-rRNA [Kazachstania b
MNEQIIFTTNSTGSITNVHSYEQANLRQCTVASKNSAVRVGEKYLFVAQAQKALIHVYSAAYNNQRESVEQRLPLPEKVNCLEVVENNASIYSGTKSNGSLHNLPQLNLPYLLLASTESGKLYIWELNSGILLNVKLAAHYQAITKIKSIMNGKYIITSGKDSRVIIWQTNDLVSQDEPKPVAILHDHTLPVTDFEVSSVHGDNLFTSGVKLYTVSKDSTLRCYDLSTLVNQGNNKRGTRQRRSDDTAQLLATFTLPYPIDCIALDPAERAVYLGTQVGCYSLPLFYKLNGNKILNLLQPSSGNQGKIYSLIEEPTDISTKINKDALFAKNQLICNKFLEDSIVCLKVSMDGSILLLGDKHGRVHVTEIFSKQVLKTLQSLTTSQTMIGEVTNILLSTYSTVDNEKLALTMNKNNHNNKNSTGGLEKLPALQRVILDKGQANQSHDVWYQIGEEYEGQTDDHAKNSMSSPLNNLEEYLLNVQSEEIAFMDHTGISSDIITPKDQAQATSTTSSNRQEEIDTLNEKVTTLTKAYTDLREIHEKLYKEHQQLQE